MMKMAPLTKSRMMKMSPLLLKEELKLAMFPQLLRTKRKLMVFPLLLKKKRILKSKLLFLPLWLTLLLQAQDLLIP